MRSVRLCLDGEPGLGGRGGPTTLLELVPRLPQACVSYRRQEWLPHPTGRFGRGSEGTCLEQSSTWRRINAQSILSPSLSLQTGASAWTPEYSSFNTDAGQVSPLPAPHPSPG